MSLPGPSMKLREYLLPGWRGSCPDAYYPDVQINLQKGQTGTCSYNPLQSAEFHQYPYHVGWAPENLLPTMKQHFQEILEEKYAQEVSQAVTGYMSTQHGALSTAITKEETMINEEQVKRTAVNFMQLASLTHNVLEPDMNPWPLTEETINCVKMDVRMEERSRKGRTKDTADKCHCYFLIENKNPHAFDVYMGRHLMDRLKDEMSHFALNSVGLHTHADGLDAILIKASIILCALSPIMMEPPHTACCSCRRLHKQAQMAACLRRRPVYPDLHTSCQ